MIPGIPKSGHGNRFFVIRHGESEANVANLIVSSPDDGLYKWGLTERGKQQAIEASLELRALLTDGGHGSIGEALSHCLVFVSSDFKRARETAEIVHHHLIARSPILFEPRLRERDFGIFNMTDSTNYDTIWAEDLKDSSHTRYSCESVLSVFSRTCLLIEDLDQKYRDKVILLVSHGDTIQITRTTYAHLEPGQHQWLPRLGNCDVVELKETIETTSTFDPDM